MTTYIAQLEQKLSDEVKARTKLENEMKELRQIVQKLNQEKVKESA